VGHATYDLPDSGAAKAMCRASSDHCTLCPQADGSGRYTVYEYTDVTCVCPDVPSTEPAPPPAPSGQCAGADTDGTPDAACAGNVGCTELGVQCGECACTLCWNETCVDSICDDGGAPECQVPLSACGELAQACGGQFTTPVYGGDPDVCNSGCAIGDSTCAALWACDSAGAAPLDDTALCQATCKGCGQAQCDELCAACPATVLAATTCEMVGACPQ
jgi:hypothetical protein